MYHQQLDQVTNRLLAPLLSEVGFSFEGGTFCRELQSGVVHLIGFSHDPRTNATFQVLCGLCARLLYGDVSPSEMGYVGARHLTAKGWHHNSGRWPCADESEAIESLTNILALIPTVVEPWFQEHITLSSVADEEEDRFAVDRARLFLADGHQDRARKVLEEHLQLTVKRPSWQSPEAHAKSRQEAETLLGEITSDV